MTRKPIHRFLPLTYKPKIQSVLEGSITQSIRVDTKLNIGDFIAFHGWQGKPYHSPWSFRTPFMKLIEAEKITIGKDYIRFLSDGEKIHIGEELPFAHPDLDELAALDGIEPTTGEELIRVLHGMHGKGTLHGKILRWDPESLFNVKGDDTDPALCKKCLEPYQRVGCFCSEIPRSLEQVHATIKESAPLTPPGQDFIQLGSFVCIKECPRCLQDPEGHCADDEIEKTSQDTPAISH